MGVTKPRSWGLPGTEASLSQYVKSGGLWLWRLEVVAAGRLTHQSGRSYWYVIRAVRTRVNKGK